MSATTLMTPAFFTGIAFAALLLSAGVAVGMWFGRRERRRRGHAENPQQAADMVAGLSQWTERFSGDVAQYRELIDAFAHRLDDLEERPDTPAAQSILSQVATANDRLQQRIELAEATLQKQANDISTYMVEARTDALTGLPNRRAFDDEFQRRIALWRRQKEPFSLVLLDVDHFKKLNDTYGHSAGDAVLSEVGRLLRESVENGEFVARYGGEEFALLLPYGRLTMMEVVCHRVRQAIGQCSIPFENHTLQVTLSSGAAIAQVGELGPQLVKRADEALYAAKRQGRNCSFWHTSELCEPLGDAAACDSRLMPTPASRTREAASSAAFREVCTDLRRRLLEVSQS